MSFNESSPRNGAPQYIEAFDGADPTEDEELLTLGNQALELLRKVRLAIDLGANSAERRMAQMCGAFFAGKIYRVTRAILTLARHGQGREATALLREQFEFILSLLYFQKHEFAATLFMASHPVTQLRMAEKSSQIELNPEKRAGFEHTSELLRSQVNAARAKFPALLKPCPGKHECKKFGTLHEHDWSAPKPKAMLKDLIRDWLKEWHATNATRLKRGELEQQTHEIAEWKLFYSLHFLSQEKHGLPFALINNLAINGGQVDDVETQVSDPNDLLYYAIASTQAAISDIATNNEIFALREAIVVWEEKLQACKERLKIADSNPSLTALRPR
jgi:hypothetical protein